MNNIAKIVKFLSKNNYKLSIAESCTGGLISSLFTDTPGASGYIEQNFVTYSIAAKIRLLGASPGIIEKFGVVSEQTAFEMARGLILNHNADFALSTTGVLGPGPVSFKGKEIKAGTVFICAAAKKGGHKTIKYVSDKKTRIAIKKDIANFAIEFLREFVEQFASVGGSTK